MSASLYPAGVKPISERPQPKTICMFDVDGTLTPARLKASPTMIGHLKALRDVCATAFVGGSDLAKQEEQLGIDGANSESHPVTGVSPLGKAGKQGGVGGTREGMR